MVEALDAPKVLGSQGFEGQLHAMTLLAARSIVR